MCRKTKHGNDNYFYLGIDRPPNLTDNQYQQDEKALRLVRDNLIVSRP